MTLVGDLLKLLVKLLVFGLLVNLFLLTAFFSLFSPSCLPLFLLFLLLLFALLLDSSLSGSFFVQLYLHGCQGHHSWLHVKPLLYGLGREGYCAMSFWEVIVLGWGLITALSCRPGLVIRPMGWMTWPVWWSRHANFGNGWWLQVLRWLDKALQLKFICHLLFVLSVSTRAAVRLSFKQ